MGCGVPPTHPATPPNPHVPGTWQAQDEISYIHRETLGFPNSIFIPKHPHTGVFSHKPPIWPAAYLMFHLILLMPTD